MVNEDINKNLKYEIIKFEDNGFLLLKNVIPHKLISSFENSFFSLFNKMCNENLPHNFDDPNVHEVINYHRKKNPLIVKRLYFTSKQMKCYQSLFYNNKLSSILEVVFKIPSRFLIFSEYQFRFDVPLDKDFVHNWHQDSAYYPQDSTGWNSVVVNISIQNNTKDMGNPNLVIKSHKDGKLNFENNIGSNTKIVQLNVDNKLIDEKNIVVPETERGDVVLYNMNLIHKSGHNSSNKTRFSALSRVFNPFKDSYNGFLQVTKLIS